VTAERADAGQEVKLAADDLFHPFSQSPIPEIRRRAAFIRQHAYCPHPEHRATKVPTVAPQPDDAARETGEANPAHVHFECPDCGIPVYCSEEHWMSDYDKHLEICDTLREINEDDHDLRSGRVFTEFQYAEEQTLEFMVNMTNWDTFLYTREFDAIDEERKMRQATRLLTYPVTIGSVLHELSPYGIRDDGRLTPEGLKSFSGKFGCRCNFLEIYADCRSPPIYASSAAVGQWLIRQDDPTTAASGPSFHSGRESRVIAPQGRVDSTISPVS